MKKFIFLCFTLIFFYNISQAGNFTWTGSQNTLWSNSANWSPTGVPSASDNVTIVTTSNQPDLITNTTVARFTMSSGTLNLNNHSLWIADNAEFTGGYLSTGIILFRGSTINLSSTTFNCKVDLISNNSFSLYNCSFLGKSSFSFSGSTPCYLGGGNTFADSVAFNNSGAQLYLGRTLGDVFNGVSTFSNSGLGIYISFSSISTFNNNLIVNNSNDLGIYIGYEGNSSTTLSSGKTITIGSSGFNSGQLILKNFNQLGNTSQSLDMTGSSLVNLDRAVFNGQLSITAPNILFTNSTFNKSVSLTKSGPWSNSMDGGNVFNDEFVISATGGPMRISYDKPNTYNGNVQIIGAIDFVPSGINLFRGNITMNSSSDAFTGNGKVKLIGTKNQTISGINGANNLMIGELIVDKDSGFVVVSTKVSILRSLTLTKGIINSSSSSILFINGSTTVSGGSNQSCVNGPIQKAGNTAFTFPVGKLGNYRPIRMSAPSNSGDVFQCQFIEGSNPNGVSTATTDVTLTDCDYWDFIKISNANSSVKLSADWDGSFCGRYDNKSFTLLYYNTDGLWYDLSTDSVKGTVNGGTIYSKNIPLSYSKIGIGIVKGCQIAGTFQNSSSSFTISFSPSSSYSYSPLSCNSSSFTFTMDNNFYNCLNTSPKGWCYITVTDPSGLQTTKVYTAYSPTTTSNIPFTFTINGTGTFIVAFKTTKVGYDNTELVNSPLKVFNYSQFQKVVTLTIGTNNSSFNLGASPGVLSCDGSPITLQASNIGIGTYLWSNGSTSNSINATSTNVYTATITDQYGCTAVKSISVNIFNFNPSLSSYPTKLCFGQVCSLSLNNPSGSDPISTYLWSNGSNSQTISNISNGTYSVTATSINGCQQTVVSLPISISPPISINLTQSPSPVCTTGGTYTLEANASGGAGGSYNFVWSAGLPTSGPTTSSISLPTSNTGTGVYTVTVTDSNSPSCSSKKSISTKVGGISVTTSILPITWCSSPAGKLNLTITGNSLPYSYTWTNSLYSTSQNGMLYTNNSTISPLLIGNYSLTLVDNVGCTVNVPFSIP